MSMRSDPLAELLKAMPPGPVLVHSDIVRVRGLVAPTRDRWKLLDAHVERLVSAAGGRDLWFPSFHYGFPRTGRFDVRTSPSEVGVLSERFRVAHANWRTLVPMFSLTGSADPPDLSHARTIDPFGDGSAFRRLAQRDGSVLFYGAPFSSGTFLHHVERAAGGPAYRYDKLFLGTMVDASGGERAVELDYHVRPRGRHLDYDWVRLERDLTSDGLLATHETPGARLMAYRCRDLRARWLERLADDHLYLLDEPSRAWVGPELDRLGRRFDIADFEPVEGRKSLAAS